MLKAVGSIALLSTLLSPELNRSVSAQPSGTHSASTSPASAQPINTQPSAHAASVQSVNAQAVRVQSARIRSISLQSVSTPELIPPREIIYQRDPVQLQPGLAPGIGGQTNRLNAGTPLNFEAAAQAVKRLRSLPSGFISYEGRQALDVSTRGCWVVDQRGRRIDLSVLCNNQ